MAHQTHEQVDAVTGVATTGHSWDDIQELNNPLPRWWLWSFYASIVWGILYMIAYPAVPLVTSYTRGLLGWQSREAVEVDLAALKDMRSGMTAKLAAASLDDIKQEAPHAYKGIGPVVQTLEGAGLARPVVELTPLMTIKG